MKDGANFLFFVYPKTAIGFRGGLARWSADMVVVLWPTLWPVARQARQTNCRKGTGGGEQKHDGRGLDGKSELMIGIFPQRLGKNLLACRLHFVSLQREH